MSDLHQSGEILEEPQNLSQNEYSVEENASDIEIDSSKNNVKDLKPGKKRATHSDWLFFLTSLMDVAKPAFCSRKKVRDTTWKNLLKQFNKETGLNYKQVRTLKTKFYQFKEECDRKDSENKTKTGKGTEDGPTAEAYIIHQIENMLDELDKIEERERNEQEEREKNKNKLMERALRKVKMQPNILNSPASSESITFSESTPDELKINDKTQDDRVFRLLVSYTDNKTSKKDRIKQRKRRHKLEKNLKVLKNDIEDLKVVKNDIEDLKNDIED
ncbi:uncharacterized protein SCDLUD_001092 [Saccharomycodes ludwigii]|uniref:uncharacterized protein n=1 Tax=Saccharomycodes ludwigii TaxID=36035 RepID=UPI001E8B8C6C|nr:hypothetical protein SCDLUD_001092 [Saccharomycodes ludwigii]KAH3903452.1 hypothetical protein SCDLUD_001092 [Saccharomycodes ludwigii]